jgi:hypothetical protein
MVESLTSPVKNSYEGSPSSVSHTRKIDIEKKISSILEEDE